MGETTTKKETAKKPKKELTGLDLKTANEVVGEANGAACLAEISRYLGTGNPSDYSTRFFISFVDLSDKQLIDIDLIIEKWKK